MKRYEAGFSIIDVMIAITILLVGVLALVAATTRAIVNTTVSQETLIAKQYAASTIEEIFTARDLSDTPLVWDSIGNVGSTEIPGGMFVAGVQDIWPTAGEDGIVGTADDAAGPDGILGNSDDGAPAKGFRRQITITSEDVRPPAAPPTWRSTLRRIDVDIFYLVGGRQFQERFTTFIANYRTSDTE